MEENAPSCPESGADPAVRYETDEACLGLISEPFPFTSEPVDPDPLPAEGSSCALSRIKKKETMFSPYCIGRGGARPGLRADGTQKQAKNWRVLEWEEGTRPTTIDGFWKSCEYHCSSHMPDIDLPTPLLGVCNKYPNATQRAANPNKDWQNSMQYEERRCGAANWYCCDVRFKAQWIGPKEQTIRCVFWISGDHNSHRCVAFLVSVSIHKCFSSTDAPDRSHGLAPHVRTKIVQLVDSGTSLFMNGSLFMSCELNRCFPKNSNS